MSYRAAADRFLQFADRDQGPKRPSGRFSIIIERHQRILLRLSKIASIRPEPGPQTALLEWEEAALIWAREQLISRAIEEPAHTLEDLYDKLHLWQLYAIGEEQEPDTLSDELVLSAITDLHRVSGDKKPKLNALC